MKSGRKAGAILIVCFSLMIFSCTDDKCETSLSEEALSEAHNSKTAEENALDLVEEIENNEEDFASEYGLDEGSQSYSNTTPKGD